MLYHHGVAQRRDLLTADKRFSVMIVWTMRRA
jgi:hypothetical protein